MNLAHGTPVPLPFEQCPYPGASSTSLGFPAIREKTKIQDPELERLEGCDRPRLGHPWCAGRQVSDSGLRTQHSELVVKARRPQHPPLLIRGECRVRP